MVDILSLFDALLFFIIFFLFACKWFRLSFYGLALLLPAYLIPVDLGFVGRYRLPTTVLELAFGAFVLAWLLRYSRDDWKRIKVFFKTYHFFSTVLASFLAASVISIFVSDMWWCSFGQWRAYFLEPMLLLVILIGRQHDIRPRHIVEALALSTASISIYAIIQAFTGWGIATPEWTTAATRRVTAFFTSPNAVGLYLGPIIPLMVSYLWVRARAMRPETSANEKPWVRYGMCALILLSLAALFFSYSQGAWIAVTVGMIVFLFMLGWRYRVAAVALAIGGIAAAAVIPSIRTALLFQDKAGQNRLMLWNYSWNYLTASPQQFVFGTGIRQFFRKIQKPYYDDTKMERLIYPHNIFLNFWTETGLLGMVSFVALFGYAVYASYRVVKYNRVLGGGLIASLTVILIHGLVDVPYFKNDLAMLFWVIICLVTIMGPANVEESHTSLPSKYGP